MLQGLGNSKNDVKESAIGVVCSMFEQLGDVVVVLIQSSELNDLLKKKVMDQIANTK